MDFTQLEAFNLSQSTYNIPFPLSALERLDNFIFINNKIVYAVENVSLEYDTTNDIIIKDEHGNDIGVLLFLKNKEFDILLLTEYQYVALLIDTDDVINLHNPKYSFKYDYVVIDEQYFLDYEYGLKNSAPIWGKFNHNFPGVVINPPLLVTTPFVTAIKLQGFTLPLYFESSIRGIQQFSPLERFLKFYHLLELNFDYDIIRKIQNLNIATESHKIGRLLREFEPKEYTRLTYLFDTYCTNINPIITKLNRVSLFTQVAKDMLFTFGKKESNPFIKDYSKYLTITSDPGLFSFANYQHFIKNHSTADDYRKFFGRLSMYIIYRVRNSIAHNKIGEYVLTSNNQNFVSEFAEPLLIEILKQVFR